MQRSIASSPWFWIVLLMILIALVGVVSAHADPYVALTDEQAMRYDLGVLLGHAPSVDELAAYVQTYPGAVALSRETTKLDFIEHSTPIVQVPAFVAALSGRDLVWNWEGPMVVTVSAPGDLLYNVQLKGGETKGFAPPDKAFDVLLWQILAGVGLVGGAILGHMIK